MQHIESKTNKTALSFSQSMARKWIFQRLQQVQGAALQIQELWSNQTIDFGTTHAPAIVFRVHHANFYQKLIKGGSIGAAESYIDGDWDTPDLTQALTFFATNEDTTDAIESNGQWLTKLSTKIQHWLNSNSIKQAKRNISAHYDLGNDLYHSFLDESMLYSSALYRQGTDSLELAQQQKMARLCEQLSLQPSDHVLEIGTGWGAMAIYMATHYGCQVTTTTISEQQYDYVAQKITELNLQDKITLLKQDYRRLEGQFDKLVSIEMIEAVGEKYLPQFIDVCQQRLKPSGKMALQMITISDQRFDYYRSNVDFIQAYIFPGGFLPSVSYFLNQVCAHSPLIVRNLHDFGFDYARTLADWQQRFHQSEATVRALGYDERFIRLWHFYFSYCQAGFLAKTISVVQITLEKQR
ncbi:MULTISPECIES: cyclopropane-fatty-acyl-phospholipid synthase family protein [unclassified Vibrio]|uniref:Class I SAM-dependent methyltransferase n=1 Tax=Vibrio sp. HB236076 TaxID=3232307 RepID=A0AB39H736_9VIBR|nr:cyclopropane-fatty-acyl-phospholipid synthase family protein [Vibrio sp. HB161653]MDP5253652.1 cyclopropane-fatty-acyl-phospholipid synthase family protein [Vibrio sp. HB161653]